MVKSSSAGATSREDSNTNLRARKKASSGRTSSQEQTSSDKMDRDPIKPPPAGASSSLAEASDGIIPSTSRSSKAHSTIDRAEMLNMVLLVMLYAIQGIPLGLTMGAMPFLLQAKLSYTQMGLFSLSAYPYSMKLLWSPIVDSLYSSSFGRRKSWIVPIQLLSALLLVSSAGWIEQWYHDADVMSLTWLFFVFVLLAATQDIAVDGWALALLSEPNLEYASTCQTIGMNIGYFTSFTAFLALNNAEFCNKYVRSISLLGLERSAEPMVTLSGYASFWGWLFAATTIMLALFKKEGRGFSSTEEKQHEEAHGLLDKRQAGREAGSSWVTEVAAAYRQLWGVVKLPAVWRLSLLLVTYRLGTMVAESAASLKLLDKGVAKESLAFLVLFQFPVELVSALIAGRWATSATPYHPFMSGYFVRLLMGALLMALVAAFPADAASFSEHFWPFLGLAAIGLATSFTSTLMFTAIGSFFNRISDPGMGGAYLTLLNTIANMGIILPKTPVFYLMDVLTVVQCQGGGAGVEQLVCPKKPKEMLGDNECTAAGGACVSVMDGFYMVGLCLAVLGVLLGLMYMRLFPALIALPLEKWRARNDSRKHSAHTK